MFCKGILAYVVFKSHVVQCRMISVVNFFVFLRLLLAHLSLRLIGELIGELIGYSWSVVVHNAQNLLLRNRFANQSQILCGAFLGRGNDILRHLGHMTKMTATPIYG